MTRMTGGQAIVRSLKQYDIDTIFVLPGVQLDHFFNALYDEGNSIRAVHSRHEQGAAYMALGYAQSSGKVGTFAVVPGPGLLNTTAALATAYGCCAPVLAIHRSAPGQGNRQRLRPAARNPGPAGADRRSDQVVLPYRTSERGA